MSSHRSVIRQIAEKEGLKQAFVEAVAATKDEKRKATVLHALAGKPPGKTGRTLCEFCQCRMSDETCNQFERHIDSELKRIRDEYVEVFCPECKSKIEEMQDVEVIDSDFEANTEIDESTLTRMTDTEMKTQLQPCGCLLDEPKRICAVDMESLNRDTRNGEVVYGYNGDAMEKDPLEDY